MKNPFSGVSPFEHLVVQGPVAQWLDLDPLDAFTALYAASAVANAGEATVQVEKGWATGVLQDLYPATDGTLWTGPNGSGQTAAAFQDGEFLFITKFYNQSSWPVGPAVAISDDRRCLLDVTASPCIAGIGTGTQHPNQHATERGYTLPVQLNEQGLYTMLTVTAAAGTETTYPIQDATRNWRVDANANARHFASWGLAVGHLPHPTMPQMIMQWDRDTALEPLPNAVDKMAVAWGNVTASILDATTSPTLADMTALGPTGALRGKCWVFGVAQSDIPLSEIRFGGMPRRLAPLLSPEYGPDEFTIAFPQKGDVIPMHVSTQTADIPVRGIGRPNQEFQARFNGGAWQNIGTSDANGVIDLTLPNQSMELGSLGVREGSTGAERTVSNVGVGLVIVGCGESGADGRGDNITLTDSSYAFVDKLPIGTTRKWMALIAEVAYDYFDATARCPVGFFFNTQGSTWMVPRPSQASTDGHWNTDNDGTPGQPMRVQAQLSKLIAANADLFPARVRIIEDLGLNDASVGAGNPDMTADWQTYAIAKREAWRAIHPDLNVHHIASLCDAQVADASLNRVRDGQVALWNVPDAFGCAGSQAHLDAPSDVPNHTHLWTQAEKLVAAQYAFRCAILGDRAPRYVSHAVTGADIAVTLDRAMTISASSDVAGWAVEDSNGARTVTSVAVSGAVVTLTCDQALVGPGTVRWIDGANAVGTTLLDSHDFPMPPEPFEVVL